MRKIPLNGLLVAAVLVVYGVLAFAWLPGDVVYSGDMGIKFVQARALLHSHFRSLTMPYRGDFIDPARDATPFRAPFVLRTPEGVQAIFPPAGAVLEAGFVWLDGLHGMRLLSILGALLAIVCAMRLAPAAARPWVAPVLGLATPLWFYGVTEWEHAPAVGLCTAAFLVALTTGTRGALAAGALLGAAAALRDECALLLVGLVLASWKGRSSWRAVVLLLVGFGAVLALNGAMDVYWFGRPPSAHLQHAVHLLREDTSLAGQPGLTPLTTHERYQAVVEYWLVGAGGWRTIALLAAVALAVALQYAAYDAAAAIVVAGIAATAIVDAAALVHAPKFVAGFYRSAPFVLFAVLRPPRGQPPYRLRWIVLSTAAFYLAIAFLTTDTMGGKAMGARLLLPLLPLVVVVALVNIRAHRTAPARASRALGAIGLVLVAAAFAIHLASTMPAWINRTQQQAADVKRIMATGAGVIVADDMYTAQALLPLYYRRIVMLADTPARGAALGEALARAGVPDVVLVTRQLVPQTELPPYTPASTSMYGGLLIQVWRR